MPFEPFIDGTYLSDVPLKKISADNSRQLLIGFNHEEGNILFAPSHMMDKVRGWFIYYAAFRYRLPLVQTAYIFHAADPFKKVQPEATQMLTDIIYRVPGLRLAKMVPQTYIYEFGWQFPAFDGHLGAAHGVELPFVFNHLHAADWSGIVGHKDDQDLADTIQDA